MTIVDKRVTVRDEGILASASTALLSLSNYVDTDAFAERRKGYRCRYRVASLGNCVDADIERHHSVSASTLSPLGNCICIDTIQSDPHLSSPLSSSTTAIYGPNGDVVRHHRHSLPSPIEMLKLYFLSFVFVFLLLKQTTLG